MAAQAQEQAVKRDGDGTSDARKRAKPNRMKLTPVRLDDEAKSRHHGQKVIWDAGTGAAEGLSALVSRGSKRTRTATISFRVVYYLKDQPGKPFYKNLGRYPTDAAQAAKEQCIKDIRKRATLIRDDAQKGIDPNKPQIKTGKFAEAVTRYIEDQAKPNQRTWEETKRIFDVYVVPQWGDKEVESLTWKAHIQPLLNDIANGKYKYGTGKAIGTPAVARSVRAHLVVFFNWYVEHHASDGYGSPMVKTRKSREWKPPARERVLKDEEIRALWRACGEMENVYAGVIKCALLTAQRFQKVAQMRRSDLKPYLTIPGYMKDNEWVPDERVPNVWDATREDEPKNKRVSVVPLSDMARKVIGRIPVIDADKGEDFVFTHNGRSPLRGWSKLKKRLDKKMLEAIKQEEEDRARREGRKPSAVELPDWQHRDLRRTARTLMARAGVSNEVAEHCLAHTLPAIQATYNRYGYLAEKCEAFAKLAWLIDRIVNPADNLTSLVNERRKRIILPAT
jgi:integrase